MSKKAATAAFVGGMMGGATGFFLGGFAGAAGAKKARRGPDDDNEGMFIGAGVAVGGILGAILGATIAAGSFTETDPVTAGALPAPKNTTPPAS